MMELYSSQQTEQKQNKTKWSDIPLCIIWKLQILTNNAPAFGQNWMDVSS